MCWRGMSHVFNCFKMAYVLKFDYSETFLSVIYFIKVSFRSFVGIKAYCVVVKLVYLCHVPRFLSKWVVPQAWRSRPDKRS